MGNPLWLAGGKSPNPEGRPKKVDIPIRAMVERFIKKNITPKRLSIIFNQLSPKEQCQMLLELLPFTIARVETDSISNEDVEKLYAMLEKAQLVNSHVSF